jgi:hypothetical protein
VSISMQKKSELLDSCDVHWISCHICLLATQPKAAGNLCSDVALTSQLWLPLLIVC